MEVESTLIAKELLFWHGHIRRSKTADTVTPYDLIPYKKLCERAGIPDAHRIVGR